jgi:glycosyltransferase involved in cell wall biosynthesis
LDKELIILSNNFGTSYSGGCTATASFAQFWKNAFKNIHVVCKQTDGFLKDDIVVWVYDDQVSLDKILLDLAKRPTIGYGDFHTAVHFITHNIPFYFTYHDNYPELKDLDVHTTEADKMMHDYAQVFSNAQYIFSVSASKLDYIKSYTDNCTIIRNGISQPITKKEKLNVTKGNALKILMAGNITSRKYKYAVDLFDLVASNGETNIEVDIFGINQDRELYNQLNKYDFVKVAPFQSVILYNEYHIYLSTSTIENLSLSVVDSLMNSTPVLTFNVGGLNEVINNKNGVLVAPYKVQEMFSAINKIRNSITQYRFDQNKLEDFNWEKSAQLMLNIMITN